MPMKADPVRGRFALIALTPLDLEADVYRGRRPLSELGGALVVSACLGRPLRVGGWDSRPGCGPLPMQPVLAPGSVLFCEGGSLEAAAPSAGANGGMVRIGGRATSGFGLAAVGRWP